MLLALPVVGLFALMLANADPVLGTLWDSLADAMARLAFVPRLLFFGALFAAALGACGVVLHRGAAPGPAPEEAVRTPRLADIERLVVLGAVGALFSAFLLLQLSYPGSGITFAEYARRGFAELTTVATLCTILLAALDHWAARGPREGWRLYAHACMVAGALFLGMLGWGLARGLTPGWLARRAAGTTAVAMAALLYWNHEAWIVRQNVERFLRSHQLDTSYLVWELSPDAAPALIRAMDRLPPILAESVRDGLRRRYGKAPHGAPCRWFEWNRGREGAAAALRAAGIVRGDAQLHPRDCVLISPPSGPPA